MRTHYLENHHNTTKSLVSLHFSLAPIAYRPLFHLAPAGIDGLLMPPRREDLIRMQGVRTCSVYFIHRQPLEVV